MVQYQYNGANHLRRVLFSRPKCSSIFPKRCLSMQHIKLIDLTNTTHVISKLHYSCYCIQSCRLSPSSVLQVLLLLTILLMASSGKHQRIHASQASEISYGALKTDSRKPTNHTFCRFASIFLIIFCQKNSKETLFSKVMSNDALSGC